MSSLHIHCDDVLTWLSAAENQNQTFDAVLSDPPYALISINHRFGKPTSAPAQFGSDGRFQRLSRGFMGQQWDGFLSLAHYHEWTCQWAKALLTVLPGDVPGLFYGGSRTFHRLAAGLEKAGWRIQKIISWAYGSGMPKSHDLSKMFDDAAQIKREIPTQPATDLAQTWYGYGTSIRPAWEVIIFATTPGSPRQWDIPQVFYQSKAPTMERLAGLEHRSDHPTMKPLLLNQLLAQHLRQHGGERLLVPFAGVGSEIIGGHLAGWPEVVGIEKSENYAASGCARLRWWGHFPNYDIAKLAYQSRQDMVQMEWMF